MYQVCKPLEGQWPSEIVSRISLPLHWAELVPSAKTQCISKNSSGCVYSANVTLTPGSALLFDLR